MRGSGEGDGQRNDKGGRDGGRKLPLGKGKFVSVCSSQLPPARGGERGGDEGKLGTSSLRRMLAEPQVLPAR